MIKSVKKAMDILTILSDNAETPITLSELSEKTGLNKSTCAHILDTMCESFYVERVSRKDGYRLGPWAYMLSRYGSYHNSLTKTASPVLKWLHAQTGATVFLSVMCNGKKYIIYHIDKESILPMSDGSMIQGFMDDTATGKLLMAYMDTATLNYTLSRRSTVDNPQMITPELQAEFKKIRSSGYAYVDVVPNQTQSYAFPVLEDGKAIAALGVLYSNRNQTEEYRSSILKFGHMAATEISRRIAFN